MKDEFPIHFHTGNMFDEAPDLFEVKDPRKTCFPEKNPEGCGRNCKRFYQAHTGVLSFAMYATEDPTKLPRDICVYAFSCGINIDSVQFTLRPTETPVQLMHRIIPELLEMFAEIAVHERSNQQVKDN